MKHLKIFKSKLDLISFPLDTPSILIGRSAVCDQILREVNVKPFHFLLEWVGEGEFNPAEGFWTVYDISQQANHQQMTEALVGEVLTDSAIKFGEFYFELYEDRISSTDIDGGKFSHSILEGVVNQYQLNAESNAEMKISANEAVVIELVRIKSEDDSVINVSHLFQKSNAYSRSAQYPELQIAWKLHQQMDIHFLNPPQEMFKLKSKEMITSSKFTLGPQDILRASYDKYYLLVRFVKANNFQFTRRLQAEEAFVKSFAVIMVIVFFCLLTINRYFPPAKPIENTSSDPRLVTIKDYEPPQPNAISPPVTTLPPPESVTGLAQNHTNPTSVVQPEIKPEPIPPQEKPIAAPMVTIQTLPKVNEKKKNDLVKNEKEKSSAASGVSHKVVTSEKNNTGLNAPAKVTDVNQVGLLAKIKGSKSSSIKISEQDLKDSFQTDAAVGSKGTVNVKIPVGGILDPNLKKSQDQKNQDLSEASTTLNGAETFSTGNVGPLANTHGIQDKITIGSGLSKRPSLGLGGASSLGLEAGARGVQVLGGLTKSQVQEEIAKHRREIRTCFESALMLKNSLHGTVTYEWEINVDGSVNLVNVLRSELKSSVLETCVMQIIKDITFPKAKNGQRTKVIYPFLFQKT